MAEHEETPVELTGKDSADLAAMYSEQVTITDAEKLDYVFRKFVEIDALIEQAGPLLAQAGPLLEQAGPLLAGFSGQASSPLGRIAGSLFRS